MAIDSLDLGVLIAIFLGLVAYFTKGKLWATGEPGSSGFSVKGSRDLIEVLNKNNKKALVFYASQTGTAEDYAHKFSKEFQSRFSIPTMCVDLADYDYENLHEVFDSVEDFKLMTFFMATYGEGEPTDNSVEFFDYLDNDCDDLSNLKFCCFGLGNSTYEFYNAMGTRVTTTLQEKDATLIGEMGLGDDGRATMDEDYLAWKDSLFDVLKSELNLEEHEIKYQASLKCSESSILTTASPTVSLGEPNSNYVNPKSDEDIKSLTTGPFDHSHPYLAPVSFTKELFNSKTRHCIHAEFDLSGSNIKYTTGDHIAIWPSNSNEAVAKLLDVLGLTEKKDTVIELSSLDPTVQVPVPSPTTYEAVLRHYLEITGPVSRQFLKSIIQFSPSKDVEDGVTALANDKQLFHSQITEKYLNIADALIALSKGLKWDSVPFEFMVESVAHLQPRYYSISSSSISEKDTVHVTAVVESESYPGVDHVVTGVATNLLWNIQLAQNKIADVKAAVSYDLSGPRNKFSSFKLPIHIRRSTFKLPSNPATPIIMIGPGTGVAPFRGFIRERAKQVEDSSNEIGESLLFFGSRNPTEDFLYQDEWVEYSKKLGDSFKLITAFSREGSEKVYVQHKMMEMAGEINELLNKGAFFYVCGDASRMSREVQATLVKILMQERKTSEEIATDMAKNFRVLNRYQEDVW